MKMNKKDLVKYVIVGIILLIIIGVVILLLGNNKEDVKLNINSVSDNYVVDNSTVMSLYNRYNSEKGLLFNLIGSNTFSDYYGYFYSKDKITYSDLDNVIKNTILINDSDYKTGEYNDENNCYYMTKDNFGVIYNKLYGKDDYNLNFDDSYPVEVRVEEDNICISDGEFGGSYNKLIDTYMVNAVEEDNYISIYEVVAFIKIEDGYLYYYKDYDMKNLVYKIELSKNLDRSFINNANIVSNVLVEYQDKFDLYEYTYVKGVDSYYLESIEK